MANNILSFISITFGGGAISFATFVTGVEKVVAYIGAGALTVGILLLVVSTVRGRKIVGETGAKSPSDEMEPAHLA